MLVFPSPVGCKAWLPVECGCDKQYFHTVNTTLLSIKLPKVNDKLFFYQQESFGDGVVMIDKYFYQ